MFFGQSGNFFNEWRVPLICYRIDLISYATIVSQVRGSPPSRSGYAFTKSEFVTQSRWLIPGVMFHMYLLDVPLSFKCNDIFSCDIGFTVPHLVQVAWPLSYNSTKYFEGRLQCTQNLVGYNSNIVNVPNKSSRFCLFLPKSHFS